MAKVKKNKRSVAPPQPTGYTQPLPACSTTGDHLDDLLEADPEEIGSMIQDFYCLRRILQDYGIFV
jgi:hypothetical protein